MSIYSAFKTDPELEVNGIEIDYGTFKFRIARAAAGNQRYARALEKAVKPLRRAIQNETITEKQMMEILRKVYAETVILGWEGVTDEDGNPLEFNQENAAKLFNDLPDLFLDLKAQAENRSLFLADLREAEAGN